MKSLMEDMCFGQISTYWKCCGNHISFRRVFLISGATKGKVLFCESDCQAYGSKTPSRGPSLCFSK